MCGESLQPLSTEIQSCLYEICGWLQPAKCFDGLTHFTVDSLDCTQESAVQHIVYCLYPLTGVKKGIDVFFDFPDPRLQSFSKTLLSLLTVI